MISETQGGPRSSGLLDLLEPVARSFMEQLEHQEAMPISQMSLKAARAYMQGSQRTPMEDSSVDVEATEIAGVRVCIVRPAGQRGDLPVVLYLHGGGWVLGGPETHARIVHSLAHMAEAAVVVPDYALAPEHPYPAALNQCYAIAQHLVAAKPGSGIVGERIAVAGDSAGGNLAAALALRAVQQGDVRFCLQALICPALRAHPLTNSYQDFGVGLNLTSEDMQWFWKSYVPDTRSWNEPTVSPLNALSADLARMAPAWIVTAGCDVLRDEAEEFGERLIAAGNTATVLRCMATIHNFLIIDELAQSGPAIAATTALGRAMWDALHVNTEDTKSKDQENGRNAQAWQ